MYDQVLEEVAVDCLLRKAEPRETVEDRHKKRQAFLVGTQSGAATFIPWGVSQAVACGGISYTINDDNTNQEDQRNFLHLFQD